MANSAFRVEQIDHVEVFVPDRYEAARWYDEVLGLEIVPEFEVWAEAPGGPLMLSSDEGSTKLALFEGQPRGARETAGHHRVAFRVDGPAFMDFLQRVQSQGVQVYQDDGQPAAKLKPIDHDQSFSVYFCDPYGNRYEVTTYAYAYVSQHLFSKRK